VQHKVDAIHCTEHASRTLRSVAAYHLATVDAFTVARRFPENSPSFSAWMWAAEILAVRAGAEAHAASLSGSTLYSAATGEFLAGWSIFNP
jgi:2-polyprenyl-3-methyl-5-hydroxy-6-metoxy-1,4-benzoquinol methylase